MSAIEWTDSTWNPVRGCSRVSEGCRNCYAERIAVRFSGPDGAFDGFARRRGDRYVTANGKHEATAYTSGWTGRVALVPLKLNEPLRWRKPRRVFVNSMSDLFHESLSLEDIGRVFGVMAKARQHTFQVLTKRARRMREAIEAIDMAVDPERLGYEWPLPNVWLGVSAERQKEADERIPELLATPAAVRGVSLEPLLGPIHLRSEWLLGQCLRCGARAARHYRGPCDCGGEVVGIDWLIVGGESGPGARPCDVAWIRSILRQGREAGVAVFVKQRGSRWYDSQRLHGIRGSVAVHPDTLWAWVTQRDSRGADPSEWAEDLRVREMPR